MYAYEKYNNYSTIVWHHCSAPTLYKDQSLMAHKNVTKYTSWHLCFKNGKLKK